MVLGTTSEIAAVVRVDDWIVGDGKPGPIASNSSGPSGISCRLKRIFQALCHNLIDFYIHVCVLHLPVCGRSAEPRSEDGFFDLAIRGK